MVKQEMARVNINTLGISELKWMGKGKFNSDDHNIYYCEQKSLQRNVTHLIDNKKSPKCSRWNLKNHIMISVHFQGKPFKITIVQVYASTINAKEAEVDPCYEDLQGLLELRLPQKKVLFIIG